MKLSPRRLFQAVGIATAAGTIWGFALHSLTVAVTTAVLTVFACHRMSEERRGLVWRWGAAAAGIGAVAAIAHRVIAPIIGAGSRG